MVKQNASKTLEIYNREYVFDIGTIVIEESRESLAKDERVKKILIGG